MRRYIALAAASLLAFVLLGAMARLSGVLLVPLIFVLLLGLGFVTTQVLTGSAPPYPRIATGVFERTASANVHLSETDACASCTDERGPGERRRTYRELVFLGVPLVRLSTTETVRCETCADPLAGLEGRGRDAIDRELERGQ